MLTVVVNRKRWYRGKPNTSALRKRSGKKCCIGFLASALGVKNKDMTEVGVLDDVDTVIDLSTFIDKNGHALTETYITNDDSALTDKAREKELRAIGKRMDVRFRFVD